MLQQWFVIRACESSGTLCERAWELLSAARASGLVSALTRWVASTCRTALAERWDHSLPGQSPPSHCWMRRSYAFSLPPTHAQVETSALFVYFCSYRRLCAVVQQLPPTEHRSGLVLLRDYQCSRPQVLWAARAAVAGSSWSWVRASTPLAPRCPASAPTRQARVRSAVARGIEHRRTLCAPKRATHATLVERDCCAQNGFRFATSWRFAEVYWVKVRMFSSITSYNDLI